jgi:hypothetical protein
MLYLVNRIASGLVKFLIPFVLRVPAGLLRDKERVFGRDLQIGPGEHRMAGAPQVLDGPHIPESLLPAMLDGLGHPLRIRPEMAVAVVDPEDAEPVPGRVPLDLVGLDSLPLGDAV